MEGGIDTLQRPARRPTMRMNIPSDARQGVVVIQLRTAVGDGAGERRRQIVTAAAACFARSGFHGATMPEICAEANLSPGTVYRYFRSKEELIEAIVEDDRAESLSFLDALAGEPDVAVAIAAALDTAFADLAEPGAAALYVEVCAEAARNPRVAAVVRRHDASVSAALTALLRGAQERGEIDPSLDLGATVWLLNALFDGVIVHKALVPDLDLAALAPSLRPVIDGLLGANRTGPGAG